MRKLREHTKAAISQVKWAAASLATLRALRPETYARVDNTHAAHAFNRVTQALEHDAALALNRVWDSDARSVSLSRLVVDAEKARRMIKNYWIGDAWQHEKAMKRRSKGLADEEHRIRAWADHREREIAAAERHIEELLTEARSLVDRVESGQDREAHKALQHFRHTVLAHTDIAQRPGRVRPPMGGDIDRLLEVSGAIVEKMETLLNRNGLSIADCAEIDGRCAASLWAMLERSPKAQGE
jgi:hypothetical protein